MNALRSRNDSQRASSAVAYRSAVISPLEIRATASPALSSRSWLLLVCTAVAPGLIAVRVMAVAAEALCKNIRRDIAAGLVMCGVSVAALMQRSKGFGPRSSRGGFRD